MAETGIAAELGEELETLVDVRFIAEPSRLRNIRTLVRAALGAAGFDDQVARDVVLAVDEACTNVIIHTYEGRTDGEIELRVAQCKGGVRIVMRDFGRPIDASAVKPRSLDEVKPGGLGTHFINEIMDSTRFATPPDGRGNVLEMIKTKGDTR